MTSTTSSNKIAIEREQQLLLLLLLITLSLLLGIFLCHFPTQGRNSFIHRIGAWH
jgi:hypothetical protein